MTQLEQLRTIISREIKQKQWMQDNNNDTKCSSAYFAGALASLRYLLFILDKLINSDNDKS